MAWSHIQTPEADINNGVTSGAATFGSNVTAGSLIVVCVALFRAGGSNVSSITDSLSNTYAQDVTQTYLGTDCRQSTWRAFNSGAGANTVTVNLSACSDLTFTISEFGGALTTDPNDASNQATGTSQTPSVSVTAVDSNVMMVGSFAHAGTNRTLTSGTGYSLLAESEGGTTAMPIHSMFQEFVSSGAKTVDGSIGTGSVEWAICGTAYKPAAGGAATWGPLYGLFNNRLVVATG